MKFKNGKYLHNCGFDQCRTEFYGRLNQVYCSPECKQAMNNRKTRLVNEITKGADLKIRKANRILLDLFRPDKEGKFIISSVELANRAFPFDLPTNNIKDDRHNGILSSFGSFCFYRNNYEYVFFKI